MARIAILCFVIAFAISALAGEPGNFEPYSIQSDAFFLHDPTRDRRVEVLLLVPESNGPFPLVLFSPGFLLHGAAYRGTGELLASHGMAVALLTYSVNLFTVDHRLLVQDLLFVIKALPNAAEARGVAIDRERIGLVGHSLGGKLSFLAAAEEPTVRAVAGLDPVDGGPPGANDPARFPRAAEHMAKINVPKLLIGAERGGETRFLFPCAPQDANYQKLFDAAVNAVWEVTQLGAGHMDYLDNPDCGPTCSVCVPGANPPKTRADAQAYLVLFFRAHLLGESSALKIFEERLAQDEKAGAIRVRKK